MPLKTITQFPLFAPPPPQPLFHRSTTTEIRFSRWNNANAEKFIRHERTQKELEDQLRFQKRHDSALTIAHNYNPAPPYPTTTTPTPKSTGTPSSPSNPSIPGKKSKYSKPPPKTLTPPAFKTLIKPRKIDPLTKPPNFKIDENGVSYEVPEAPFLYQYSYTETPKMKPLKLREPLVSPFGPETMTRPWTGRKPLPPSKKKLPEFDSFKLPPHGKKGVKPVQSPGPFLPGSGPKYTRSREEVLGEPLTKEEIEELIEGSKKSSRQLNMGRDGLTHNMLDNVHALWKRRRVCKIKCKGVCTVDMENVCQQLEEKTGGKIIYSRGGVIYLFRGRNYNFRSRPRFPLMLWKPVTPVYPRLVKRAPEGLTLEEATQMRRKGRDLTPICKLAKNGVYNNLVKNVREAFEACELVRIDCQGLNPSDYRKVGAKLKDLVPCVLVSFENEHILLWRGRDWKSSYMLPEEGPKGLHEEQLFGSPSSVPYLSIVKSNDNNLDTSSSVSSGNGELEETSDLTEVPVKDSVATDVSLVASHSALNDESIDKSESFDNHSEALDESVEFKTELSGLVESEPGLEYTEKADEVMKLNSASTEQVLLLRKQAVENGMAFVLDIDSLDADIVFTKTVEFAKTAPVGPVFRRRSTQLAVQRIKEQECDDGSVSKETPVVLGTKVTALGRNGERRGERKISRNHKMEDIKADYLNVVPQGNLRVDELAKLLS
ncbi:hypothetical protein RD792_014647 [Penstemon davidsonii]|uniref:CRM domain-containing protein n=1 Tax=Penstemon davidsonii TaxID=160366 RepID=A0ABR0CRN7_9LAMI|nr:hypothetical protein RD792_014647 [Penstemon davidsonii]